MTEKVWEAILLACIVIACWLGVLGMWRMKEPTQALHYLSLPATAGAGLLALAVLLTQGVSQAFWKALLIAIILAVGNSADTHAMARAFRARELGHWEPRDGDPIEIVAEERK